MDEWGKIRSSHLYHMILDIDFRNKLDAFYGKMVEYIYTYVDADNSVYLLAKKILKSDNISLDIGKWSMINHSTFLGENFDDYTVRRFKDVKGQLKEEIFKTWKNYDVKVPPDFFSQLLAEANETKVIEKLRNEQKELISQCDSFLVELARKIEEPWKV